MPARVARALELPETAAGRWLLLVVGASCVVAASLWAPPAASNPALVGLAILLLAALGLPLRTPSAASRAEARIGVPATTAPQLAAALAIGLPLVPAVLVLGCAAQFGALWLWRHQRPDWRRAAANAARGVLAATAAALAWHLPGGDQTDLAVGVHTLAAIGAYAVIDTLSTPWLLAPVTRIPLLVLWRRVEQPVALAELGLLAAGVVLAASRTAPLLAPAAVLITLAAWQAAQDRHRLLSQSLDALAALADVLDARDPYTAGHSRRVAAYAEAFARAAGHGDTLAQAAYLAGRTHDVGKAAIQDGVLRKPGPLSADEYAHLQDHPTIGAAMVQPLAVGHLHPMLAGALEHHERWDGRGYPQGLQRDQISLVGRLVAIADALDAMYSDRAYRPALSLDETRRRLAAGAGREWDPALITVCLAWLDQHGPAYSPVPAGAGGSDAPVGAGPTYLAPTD